MSTALYQLTEEIDKIIESKSKFKFDVNNQFCVIKNNKLVTDKTFTSMKELFKLISDHLNNDNDNDDSMCFINIHKELTKNAIKINKNQCRWFYLFKTDNLIDIDSDSLIFEKQNKQQVRSFFAYFTN